MRTAWQVLRDAIGGYGRHQDARLAAALAFFAVFSLAPLLLVIIGLLGLFYGHNNAQLQVQAELGQVIGTNGTQFVDVLIAGAAHHGTGKIAVMVGAGLILFAAIGIFLALQNALDEVFEIHPLNKGGFLQVVVLRLHALIVIAALAIIAIVALVLVNVIGGLMQSKLSQGFAGPAYEAGSIIVNVVAMTVFLAVVYQVLPQRQILWKSAYTGAAITAVILILGEAALSIYFTRFHPAASYGAAGGIVVILMWIFYSAQLMLFGAELTRAVETRLNPAGALAAVPPSTAGRHAGPQATNTHVREQQKHASG